MGSSSATVSAGPMPGSTPTRVPSVTPTSASSRLVGVRASWNPCISWLKESMSEAPDPGRQRDPDDHVEDEEHRACDHEAVGERLGPVGCPEHDRGDAEEQRGRDDVAEERVDDRE